MKEKKKGSVGSSNGIAINASTGTITHSGGAGGRDVCGGGGGGARTHGQCGPFLLWRRWRRKKNKKNKQNKHTKQKLNKKKKKRGLRR